MIVRMKARDAHYAEVSTGAAEAGRGAPAAGKGAPEDAPEAAPEVWGLRSQGMVTLLVLLVAMFVKQMHIYEMPATPLHALTDAAAELFPPAHAPARPLQSPYFVTGRPDIQSWRVRRGRVHMRLHAAVGQGAVLAAAVLRTEVVVGHVMTAFTGPFFVPCWKWNLLYKALNEVLEELATPVNGKWVAMGLPMEMETRYDSLVNDLVLGGLVIILLSCHAVYVLELLGIAPCTSWSCWASRPARCSPPFSSTTPCRRSRRSWRPLNSAPSACTCWGSPSSRATLPRLPCKSHTCG